MQNQMNNELIAAFCATLRAATDIEMADTPAAGDTVLLGVFAQLPEEMLVKILQQLPAKAVCMLAQTCLDFHRLASDETLWHFIYLREYPQDPALTLRTRYNKSWQWLYRARTVTLTSQALADLKTTPPASPSMSPRQAIVGPTIDPQEEANNKMMQMLLAMASQQTSDKSSAWDTFLEQEATEKKRRREQAEKLAAEKANKSSQMRTLIGCQYDAAQGLYQFGEWGPNGLIGYGINAWMDTTTTQQPKLKELYEGEFIKGHLNGYAHIVTESMEYEGNCSLPSGRWLA